MDAHDPYPAIPLGPDEHFDAVAETDEALIALTDRRVVVTEDGRTALDVPVGRIRRVELDIERDRPTSLILVPAEPRWAPQVLTIPDGEVPHVLLALELILERLRASA